MQQNKNNPIGCCTVPGNLVLFLFLRILLLTHFGESPEDEHLFPPIFWHNEMIFATKKMYNFYFFTNKKGFSGVFSSFHGQHSVTAAWTTPIPWSIYIDF